ncbi:DUF456 domain-containing protein [Chitinimonas sp. BJB300]|uniref:DUF456 domain-containing protein n=1 Tax=Chitinimonas sp. BJB300 TaxID=1559339 RepID=UPI000C0FEB09|nr:DUF456 family protein [Chitinimonas sp. BJB300]PHV13496.1 hypothetical protein CSQ89_00235 [Chitinimonas sp. BJB300]TSJ89820.1 DUF456 family protein [Chitinimonas sp. BJB300]
MQGRLWTPLSIAGYLLAIVLILAGLAGNLLPLIPTAPLLMAGFILYAWLDDFQRVGWGWLGVLLVLSIVMIVIDFIAGAWGAKKMGASRQAVIGATLGAILGIFFNIVGLIFGPFIGAAVGEWLAKGDALRAGQVGFATWLGLLVGTVAKLSLSFVMIGLFAFAYFI